jgi:vacuole morphology and inheritance protein 14
VLELSAEESVERSPPLSSHTFPRFNRLTAINWVKEFINLGGEKLLLFYSELLGAIMHCISDGEQQRRLVRGDTRLGLA